MVELILFLLPFFGGGAGDWKAKYKRVGNGEFRSKIESFNNNDQGNHNKDKHNKDTNNKNYTRKMTTTTN